MNIEYLELNYEKELKLVLNSNHMRRYRRIKYLKISNIIFGLIFGFYVFYNLIKIRDYNLLAERIFLGILYYMEYGLIAHCITRDIIGITYKDPFISELDKIKIICLKTVIKKMNIDYNNSCKIQIIIDELEYKKNKPYTDFIKVIVNPMIVLIIPCVIIFIDHLTFKEELDLQVLLFIIFFSLFSFVLIILFVFIDSIRWLLYGKYDDIITTLKIIQLYNKESNVQLP